MADYNIFLSIFPSNKKWREKCGTFFLFLFRSKYEPWYQRLRVRESNFFIKPRQAAEIEEKLFIPTGFVEDCSIITAV